MTALFHLASPVAARRLLAARGFTEYPEGTFFFATQAGLRARIVAERVGVRVEVSPPPVHRQWLDALQESVALTEEIRSDRHDRERRTALFGRSP